MALKLLDRIRLRSLIAGAAAGISVLATLALLAFLLITNDARLEIERRTEQLLVEEAMAEDLVRTVRYQLHSAELYAAAPNPLIETEFWQLSDSIHARLRHYLFRGLSGEERSLVERIREGHAHLEVEAQRVLLDSSYQQTPEIVAQLGADLDHFVELRRQRREALTEIQADLTRGLFGGAIALSLLFVGITLLLLRLLQHRFLRRVDQLSAAASRLGSGDYDVRVPIRHADELSTLGEAFNTMAADLEETHRRVIEAERRYRTLVEGISAVIWEADAATLACSYISPQAETLLGYATEEWLGNPAIWKRVTHPHDYERMARACAEATARGEDHEVEYRMVRADGNIVWMRDLVHVECDAAGRPRTLVGIMTDISATRAAAEALVASEERYRSLFDRVPIGLYVSTPEGRFVDANPACLQLLGFPTRESLLRHGAVPLVSPDERARWVQRVEREPGVVEVVWRITRPDGSRIWVRDATLAVRGADGSVIQYEGALRDVTAEFEAEEALQRREARFRSLIENASDAVIVTNAEGYVVYQSPSVLRMLGYGPGAIEGQTAMSLVHADDFDRVGRVFRAIATTEGHAESVDFRCRHSDGTWRLLHAVGSNLLHDPNVKGVVINLVDLTEHRRLEEELLQARKMDAVGRLAGGIAHDFNNLLTGIGGYSELLAAELAERGIERPELDEIRRSVDRAAALTRQLLAFSRRQVIQPRDLDLNEVILDLRGLLQRLIGEDVTLQTHVTRGAWVHADRGQLEQILVNLIVNARDAMPNGGTLRISSSLVQLDRWEADALSVAPGRFVALTVADTGIGMSSEVLARVFEPFFTTKDVGKGTGLGLATVYGIARQARGAVHAESTPGAGSEFRVYLPLIDAGTAESHQPPMAHVPAAGAERVLVVEDEPTVRSLTERVLRRQGYIVESAGNGREALELVAAAARAPDLVVTDVVMPELGGPEMVERLRLQHPDVRVLFMSGYTRESFPTESALPAELNFLKKPFTPQQLTEMVRSVLDQAPQTSP